MNHSIKQKSHSLGDDLSLAVREISEITSENFLQLVKKRQQFLSSSLSH